jgi:hypothetical protein
MTGMNTEAYCVQASVMNKKISTTDPWQVINSLQSFTESAAMVILQLVITITTWDHSYITLHFVIYALV